MISRPWRTLLRLWRLSSLPAGLLQAHAAGYGRLASAELDLAIRGWRRCLWLQAIALVAALAALLLGGVALMLWAVVPAAQIHDPWVLWVVPLAFVLLAMACRWAAGRSLGEQPVFAGLRRQLQTDLALVRGQAVDGAVTLR